MAAYPQHPKWSVDSTADTIKEAIRNESEGGYTATRTRYTRHKKSFELIYTAILIADFLNLEAFFIAYQGLVFTFYDAFSDKNYEVVFNMDKITYKLIGAGRCSTSVSLLEV